MKITRFMLGAALVAWMLQAYADEPSSEDNPAVAAALTVQNQIVERMLAGDAEAVGELISKQFVASDPSNTIRARDDLVALVASGRLKYESVDLSIDFAGQVAEDLVVVMGTETTRQSAVPVAGELKDTALANTLRRRFTDVYRREADGWRLLVKQSTIIAVE